MIFFLSRVSLLILSEKITRYSFVEDLFEKLRKMISKPLINTYCFCVLLLISGSYSILKNKQPVEMSAISLPRWEITGL